MRAPRYLVTSMEHLNYCRQAVMSVFGGRGNYQHFPEKVKECTAFLASVIERKDTVKFLLPDDGKIMDHDTAMRALAGVDLTLPFSTIALEYRTSEGTKDIVVCSQSLDDPSIIRVATLTSFNNSSYWLGFPFVEVENRINDDRTWSIRGPDLQGYFAQDDFKINFDAVIDGLRYSASVLMYLLAALSCSNVTVVESKPSAVRSVVRKGKQPLDTYHILTINGHATTGRTKSGAGIHSSPREHLRRGHIRKLESKNVWINSCVVNPGVGPAVIKDYRVTKR